MAIYREGDFTLHRREVILKGGRHQVIFFFAKKTPKSGTPTSIPDGYKVGGHNKKTGLPYLSKIR